MYFTPNKMKYNRTFYMKYSYFMYIWKKNYEISHNRQFLCHFLIVLWLFKYFLNNLLTYELFCNIFFCFDLLGHVICVVLPFC